jgi:5-methylthioadenosine/S-adenosylhomocysteine deaminase
VYACGRHQVGDVWIAGRRRLRERELVDMDTQAIVANVRQWRERIATIRTA